MSRVIKRLKEFMSDKKHKGKVITVMMTNRPDQIDIDLKRRGRMDIKIPFFFPETKDARRDILQKTLNKYCLTLAKGAKLAAIADKTENYSAGELAGIVEKCNELAGETEQTNTLTAAQLVRAFRDVEPSRDARRLKLQELLAAFESSSNEMLPERYKNMSSADLQQEIDRVMREIEMNTLRVR
jgi:SpoVK/Ycf46/Vps4 family AAA+-type ATPase